MFVFPVGPLFRLRVSHHLDHAPFPHPAHQTGRADFPHPAFGQGLLNSDSHTFAHEPLPRRSFQLVQAVRSGSLCGRRCLMLLLTCLFENPMSRRMVAEYARLHLLMPTTAGAGCFPPAIAPRAWQSLPHALAQLGRCRYLAQQREQRIHLDQLADCHHLPLHVVEQLLVGNLLRLTCLVRRQVGANDLQSRCTSAGRTTSETVPPSASCRSGAATRTRR